MAGSTPSPLFNQPDLSVLRDLDRLQRLSLVLLTTIAGTILCAWLVPPLGKFLPSGWVLMKANTAIVILLSGLSIVFTQPLRTPRAVRIGRLLGLSVALIAAMTLAEYSSGRPLGLDTIFAADSGSLFPGRMSFQTALSFLLVGIVLLNPHTRKGPLSRMVDVGALLLFMLMLVFTAGYFFGATGLFGMTMSHRLSPQTLVCLVLLTLIIFSRRTEYGIFSILIDDGIGGKTARLTAPFSLLLPFTLAELRGLVTRFDLIQEVYGVAVASAIVALVGFCFVVFIARRCQQLEAATRELSLRDQLTHLYNRRGFLLFAEQSLRLARRNGMEFFLLVIDMDGLKRVNDNLGHEAGSRHIQEMGRLLERAFRETDVIGRIGGDEFVVAGNGSSGHITDFVARLQMAMETGENIASGEYPLSFSLGQATAASDSTETLQDLVRKADVLMYEVKRSKKGTRVDSERFESELLHALPVLHDGSTLPMQRLQQ